MKNGKRQIMEGIELPNQERIRTLGEKENYKYLGIGSRLYQMNRYERKIRNEYFRRMWKLLETKLCSRNLTKVPLVRYSGQFLKQTK